MRKILLQLDSDEFPSVFDRVVAIDAGAEEIFSYGNVRVDCVEPLVHGAIFTRGPKDLLNTALFIGGSDVSQGEAILQRALSTFIGPLRVSVMLDSNGSNTTAAAAVLAARKHMDLSKAHAIVLGGTGPVGYRAAQILLSEGASVVLASRNADRAKAVCESLVQRYSNAQIKPIAWNNAKDYAAQLSGSNLMIASGAAGVELLPSDLRRNSSLKVVVDLNAVPPLGIGGVQVNDKGVERDGMFCYGALGVGGTKMKIHKSAVEKLFTGTNQILDTDAIYQVALGLG